jgi:hypothetical protein
MASSSRVSKPRAAKKGPSKSAEDGVDKMISKSSAADDSGSIYFWRESDPIHGYLSQWYYCPFTDKDDPSVVYETAEQYVHDPTTLSLRVPRVGLD